MLVTLWALTGCTTQALDTDLDGGPTLDGGRFTHDGARPFDAGPPRDAGPTLDGGRFTHDGARPFDAGPPRDAGPPPDDRSNCGPGAPTPEVACAEGLSCTQVYFDDRSELRCVEVEAPLAEGAACTWSVVPADGRVPEHRVSRCTDGLVCGGHPDLPSDPHVCARPCFLSTTTCGAGERCVGVHLFGCSRPAECDVRSGDGCGADETCYVVGGTTSAIEFACAPAVPREAGQPCDDDRCARGLLCDRGICAETCDPTWGSAPLDADGSIPIGDGGALFEPRCDDGTGHCTPVGTLTTRSGTRLGVCRR